MEETLAALSDDELLRRLTVLLRQSRCVEADLIAHIAEVDARRLYAREASPSMFAWCTGVLHLSEAEAYLRITVARASRRHPVLLEMLRDGRLHLTGAGRLAPHLTPENHAALLERATHRSRREIEELMADVSPRPDVPVAMRRLPDALLRRPPEPLPLGTGLESPAVMAVGASSWAGSWAGSGAGSGTGSGTGSGELCLDRVEGATTLGLKADPDGPPAQIQPLGRARYKVQFTASAELHDKLERLQALMRSQVPGGDLGAVIERAVTETLDRLEARRFAKTNCPGEGAGKACRSASSRHIPAAVRRAVYARDGGRCHYRDALGRRCSERHRLEYHHRHPFAVGGDHSLKNISLMCPAHNALLAEHDYGPKAMSQFRRRDRPRVAASQHGLRLGLRPGSLTRES